MIKACLFALYFVTFKFGSVITYMVTPVAKFKSASSSAKMLRLIFYGSSRERFSEISQNFRSAGYMPSARSILLLLFIAASL